MQTPVADLLDRYSITLLKAKHYPEARAECLALGTEFLKVVHEWENRGVDILPHFEQLCKVNETIWGYESALRRGQLGDYDTSDVGKLTREELLQLAVVGQQAILIRNTNLKRKQATNALSELTSTGWKDIKVNHAAEEVSTHISN